MSTHSPDIAADLALALTLAEEADALTMLLVGVDVTEEREVRERREQQERLAAIGTLAAGLAHEIRNPLNGARLHVALLARSLARDPARADEREAVGVVDDEIKRLTQDLKQALDKFLSEMAQKQGRYGTPEEVAAAVTFFASDESSWCNGSSLVLDGGFVSSLL